MSVKMNVPFLIVFLFICFKGVVGNNCGILSYSPPAFNGGNVTITYKPIKFSATEKPIIFNSDGKKWIPVLSTIMSNPMLGVFTTVFETNILKTGHLHANYGLCYSQNIHLDLQDPPSALTMNAPNITNYSQDIYTLKFSCLTDKNNDFCLISWTKDGQLLHTNGYGADKMHESSLMMFVNVSKENNGQTITCSVNCSNFDVQLSKSHSVQVPYKPSVSLSVQDEVWLNAHDTTSVTCTAKSLPLSDIVWSVNGDKQLIVCNKSIKCEIHTLPIETDEHRNHTCTAFFEFGDYDTSATISFLAIGRVVGKNCGNLSYSQPAFKGGNVTIIYKPIELSVSEKPTFFYIRGNNWTLLSSTIVSNSTSGVFTTVFDTNLSNVGHLYAKYGSCNSEIIILNLQDPPSTLTMNASNITSYSQDIYTLNISCFTDINNDYCLISWTTDGQLLRANGYGTDKIHNSSLMVFVNVSKENNGQTITCSVNCSNFDVQLSKSHSLQVPYKPSVHLSVKDEVLLNAHDSTSVTCTAKSLPFSDIVWTVNGDTQLLVCNKSEECVMKTIPIETNEHRNYTCTAYFELGNYNTSANSSFLAIGRASTNSNDIPIVWIIIGLSVIIAAVIISSVIVLARKRFLKKNQHVNASEPQPVQHVNVQENETVEMNEEVTYAQVNKIRTNRTEALGPKTKGSESNLVYADIDIDHLETAGKPPSRQRPPSPTEYAEIHTIRTESGSSSDNIIT